MKKKKPKKYKVQRCESKSVVFLFFIIIITPNNHDFNGANVKLHNSGMLGLGTIEMCQAFQTLPCDNVATAYLVVCAIKGPGKELRLSFMAGEKYVNKIFEICTIFRV